MKNKQKEWHPAMHQTFKIFKKEVWHNLLMRLETKLVI
jgi:hypothetical protein